MFGQPLVDERIVRVEHLQRAAIFAEDRRACLEAGMNDFVAKPVEPDKLFATIAKWLPMPEPADSPELPAGQIDPGEPEQMEIDEPEPDTEPFDRTINPNALSAVLGDDLAQHRDIWREFVDQAERMILEFDSAWEQRDSAQISFVAHKLKSSAGTVGAEQMANHCLALEIASREEDWKDIDHLQPELKLDLEQVKDYLRGL